MPISVFHYMANDTTLTRKYFVPSLHMSTFLSALVALFSLEHTLAHACQKVILITCDLLHVGRFAQLL